MSSKKVMAFGSFDLIHPGHIHYLQKASRMGDYLIVVVARDESIKAIKGKNPVLDQTSRALIVGSLKQVDRAVIGNKIRKHDDIYKILKQHRPSVIVFGYDQRANIPKLKAWLAENSINAEVVRVKSRLDPSIYKSSKLRSRLNTN